MPVGQNSASLPSATPGRNLVWELLVTDGHVRAARLRRLQPWIIASGLLLLWAGFFVAGLAPAVQPTSSVASIIGTRVSNIQTQANYAFSILPAGVGGQGDVNALPSATEVTEVVDTILSSLNKTGDLPDELLKLKEKDADELWKGDWETEQVNYAKSGKFYLIWANVSVGSSPYARPVRWMGAVKKTGDVWRYATVAHAGFYVPPNLPAVRPEQIVYSMSSLLPKLPPEQKNK
jgi:hypothetical protein